MADSSDDRLSLFRQQVRRLFAVVILINFVALWQQKLVLQRTRMLLVVYGAVIWNSLPTAVQVLLPVLFIWDGQSTADAGRSPKGSGTIKLSIACYFLMKSTACCWLRQYLPDTCLHNQHAFDFFCVVQMCSLMALLVWLLSLTFCIDLYHSDVCVRL